MSDVAAARPSATLILARRGREAPEFLMVRRDRRASFGGAFVFPGGVVDDDDEAAADGHGLAAADANRTLGLDAGGLGYFSAAVRELFEETGVFLGEPDFDEIDAARRALQRGEQAWRELIEGRRVFLERLHYVSYWITPEVLPKRYSTRFFLAASPTRTEAAPCGVEVHECRWLSAKDALGAGERGDILLHFPTRVTLETLGDFDSLDALMAWAAQRADAGVPCIFPSLPERRAVREAVSRAARRERPA